MAKCIEELRKKYLRFPSDFDTPEQAERRQTAIDMHLRRLHEIDEENGGRPGRTEIFPKLRPLPPEKNSQHLLTVRAVATLLNVSEKTVYRHKDKIGYVSVAGAVRFRLGRLKEYVREQQAIEIESGTSGRSTKVSSSTLLDWSRF